MEKTISAYDMKKAKLSKYGKYKDMSKGKLSEYSKECFRRPAYYFPKKEAAHE